MSREERESELRSLKVKDLIAEYRRVFEITPEEGPEDGAMLITEILDKEFSPDEESDDTPPMVAKAGGSWETTPSTKTKSEATMEQIHQNDESSGTSQVELYEDLKRIGELEDQKTAIQAEIDVKTEKLRKALKSVDSGSLLHKVLTAALTPSAPGPKRKAMRKKRTKRKTSRSS